MPQDKLSLRQAGSAGASAAHDQPTQLSGTDGREALRELTADQASRMAVTAVTADLEHWARTASVNGNVRLNDLTRILDVIRLASIPET